MKPASDTTKIRPRCTSPAPGVIPPAGVYKNFWADPFTLFFIEVVAIQFAELKRLQDYK